MKKAGQNRFHAARRPFWLPASNFYFLASAIAIGIFFLVWLLLQDGRDDAPWITAGLVTSLFLIGAVIMREVILRNARNRIVAARHRLDQTLAFVPNQLRGRDLSEKLTLERNETFLREIKRKSEAARILSSVSGSHREVFELCAFYIDLVDRELPTIGIGSPRLAAVRRGRDLAAKTHRYHVLHWVESEVRTSTQFDDDAKLNARVNGVKRALRAVEAGLADYPDEYRLVESAAALREHGDSLHAAGLIEKAERAESRGNRARALDVYREAQSVVDRLPEENPGRGGMSGQIEVGIRRLEESLME